MKEKILAKIHKTCPELKALEFGCRVKIKFEDDWFKDKEKIYHINKKYESSVQESWSVVESFQSSFHPSCFEILGKEPQLNHLLRTINEHRGLDDIINIGSTGFISLERNEILEKVFIYDLTKSVSDNLENEELCTFLSEIIL